MERKRDDHPLNYNIMDSQFQIRQNPLAVDDNWDLNACIQRNAKRARVFAERTIFHMCFVNAVY